jgi:hypothetical protein
MNDDRLSRIESKLDTVQAGLAELGVGQEELRRHMEVSQEELRRHMEVSQEELRRHMEASQEALRHHMDVLHEDVLDRIKGATLDPQVIDDKIQRGDNAVRAEMTERLVPIETAIRGLKMP